MKGQTEVIIFILLFIIGIVLFTAATIWGKSIFQQNVDVAKISSAENFLKELNNNILNLVKFGGFQEIDYNFDGTIELIDDPEKNKIELKTQISVEIPRSWVNLTSDSFYIREMLDGNIFRIQLIYPEKDYKIELFTEGPRLAKPDFIRIERNSTYSAGSKIVIKIKITFV